MWNRLSRWVWGAPRKHRHAARSRPRLECLEDRCTPATFTVNTVADLGQGSLRQAISDVNQSTDANNTINIQVGGTIARSTAFASIQNNVIITGPGWTNLAVTAAAGAAANEIFNVSAGATVGIQGLMITGGGNGGVQNNGYLTLYHVDVSQNGNSGSGGGIFNGQSATLLLQNSSVHNNSATSDGGGIYNMLGSATVINTTIYSNTAGGNGGGIGNNGGIRIYASQITGNRASNGGGIDTGLNTSSLSMSGGCILSGNTAFGYGGGLDVGFNKNVSVQNTAIRNNSATNGGGFYLGSSQATFTSCVITLNTATVQGAGGLSDITSVATLIGCTSTDVVQQ